MQVELTVPNAGESITEVEIGEWLKGEGTYVKRDETIVMLESEKAGMELPAPSSGILKKIFKKKGEKAAVGEVVGLIEPDGLPAGEKAAKQPEPETRPAPPVSSQKTQPSAQSRARSKLAHPAPSVSTRVEIPPIEPAAAPQAPIVAAPEKAAPGREEEVVPMTLLRRTVAQHLLEARQTMAILTTFNEIDLSAVIALRKEFQGSFTERHGVKLGFMSFFVKAAVDALKLVPQVNAAIRGTDIVYHHYYDLGIAIGAGRGLVVPVLRDADKMSFGVIEKSIADFASRAQTNTLKPDELQGGTFTITNGGIYGSMLSTPIVNPLQSAILGLHAIEDRPVAISGQVAIRPMMYAALSYDHRLIDGREAVMFLRRIKDVIESPARMLLEM